MVTSSPYKASLLESQAKIRGKKKSGDGAVNGKGNGAARRSFIGKKKKATRPDQEETSEEESDPKYSDSSDGEDNDAECLFCGSMFSADVHGEQWVQCTVCYRWAHEYCGASDKTFVCPQCVKKRKN